MRIFRLYNCVACLTIAKLILSNYFKSRFSVLFSRAPNYVFVCLTALDGSLFYILSSNSTVDNLIVILL